MQVRDSDFLASYAELGVTSRRIVAETMLRALVMETPPVRKVLTMQIMEQYVHAAGDLMGLYSALKQRGNEPVMRTFLQFKFDRAAAMAFAQELANTPHTEIMAALRLPMPDEIAHRCPTLSRSDVRDLRLAMTQMLGDMKRIGDMGEGPMLALAQAASEQRSGAGQNQLNDHPASLIEDQSASSSTAIARWSASRCCGCVRRNFKSW